MSFDSNIDHAESSSMGLSRQGTDMSFLLEVSSLRAISHKNKIKRLALVFYKQ